MQLMNTPLLNIQGKSVSNKSKKKDKFVIRPFYTTEQLRKIIKYKTNQGTQGLLAGLNIPCYLIGRKRIYFLSDIQTYCAALYTSILEAANLNSILDNEELNIEPENEIETDEYNTYKDSLKT